MQPEGSKTATVFLSYSRADQKRALPVIKALEAAGLQVWWDGLLEGGATYLPTTEAALESADAVVVLWSNVSVESNWVRDEAQRGRDRQCLVPLTIDGTMPPLGFRQFQVIDISKWRGKAGDPRIERAIRAVWTFAGQEPRIPIPLPRQARVSRRALIGGGAAVLVGGGALAVWKTGLLEGKASPGNSVAVLPFRNLSGDKDEDYFAEGIAEQIRLTLSRNSKLLVLAPASIQAVAKDGVAEPKSIADKLKVAYVLTGVVRRSGDELRISAALNDGATGFPSWTEEFRRKAEDVFAIQEGIADAVAAVMAAQTASAGASIRKQPGGTRNVKAYDAYLRGNAYYALRSGEAAYRSALAQYDTAIAGDRNFAAAHAARAKVLVVITSSFAQASEFKAAYGDALASARKAVALAPDFAKAHSALGFVLIQGHLDLRGARGPLEQARKLGAGDAEVLSLYSALAAELGRKDDAERAVSDAMKLDPLNPGAHRLAAFVAYCARNWPLAEQRNRRALELNPRIDQVHAYLGDLLCQQGKYAEAKLEYQAEPVVLYRLTGLAITAHRTGNQAEAKATTDKLVATFGDAGSYQQAQVSAQAGQVDLAIARLQKAREVGDSGLALAYTDPMLDPLRNRPEFLRLLSDLGFG
ncbi:MAG: TIR domain-containing protein [Sphingomonadales bacterium]|nr:TIR domain-containing protein [Sphingomonadaceae bacterium]MBS3931151.1 TIR domain-containing protein [Sphingomonadales bacterium]